MGKLFFILLREHVKYRISKSNESKKISIVNQKIKLKLITMKNNSIYIVIGPCTYSFLSAQVYANAISFFGVLPNWLYKIIKSW